MCKYIERRNMDDVCKEVLSHWNGRPFTEQKGLELSH